MSYRESYTVVGMTCGHCVQAVTDEIARLGGVGEVAIDLASGRVDITSEAPLDREAVQAAVDEAGYTLAVDA